MEASVYNQQGEKTGKTKLPLSIFNIKIKPELVHFVVTAMQSNLRQSLAHTKIRGEVSGGGKKPWRQKGTGRARAGSIRSPLWRGGSITFGPRKERNYKKKINKKIKRLALKMVLSDKAVNEKIIVFDQLNFSKIKTKEASSIFKKLPNHKEKSLIVLEKKDPQTTLSFQNIPQYMTTLADNLNVVDVINNKYLVMTKESLKKIEKTYK